MVNIPPGSIVPTQQDPYSPTILTNINTFRSISESANVRFGGTRRRRRGGKKNRYTRNKKS